MSRIISAIIVLAATSMLAPAARADDLGDAAAICMPYKIPVPQGGPVSTWKLWKPGWEHCQEIYVRKLRRDEAAKDADAARNPDLKKTRDLAKKLSGG